MTVAHVYNVYNNSNNNFDLYSAYRHHSAVVSQALADVQYLYILAGLKHKIIG